MDGWCCLYISLQGLCFTPIGMRNQCRTVSRHLTLSDFSSNRSVWFLWEWRVKSGNRGIIQKEQTMAGTWMVALVRSDSGCILTGEPVRFNNASDVNVRERACIGLLCCAQSCLTLRNPMDCSAPGSSVHGILQARILEWVAMPFSRGSSQSKDQTQVSCIYQLIYPGSPIWYTWSSIQVLWIIIGLQGKSNSSVSNLKHYLIFCWKITS